MCIAGSEQWAETKVILSLLPTAHCSQPTIKKTPAASLGGRRRRIGQVELGRGGRPSGSRSSWEYREDGSFQAAGWSTRRCNDSQIRRQQSRSRSMVSVKTWTASLSSAHSSCRWQLRKWLRTSLSHNRLFSRWLMGHLPSTEVVHVCWCGEDDLQRPCQITHPKCKFSASQCPRIGYGCRGGARTGKGAWQVATVTARKAQGFANSSVQRAVEQNRHYLTSGCYLSGRPKSCAK
jgi:hypothetical protein